MQRLTWEGNESGRTVYRIPDDGPPARREVSANLVRPAGDQPAPEQRDIGYRRSRLGQSLEFGAAHRPVGARRDDLPPIARIAAQTKVDRAPRNPASSIHHREII